MRTGLVFIILLMITTIAKPQAVRNEVVINEIMADPSPPAGLPELEFLELHNVSAQAYTLSGWKISDGSGTATISASFILKPDSFVIICSNSATTSFSKLGTTIGITNFPSLDNDSEILSLVSKEGKLIHAVEYNESWYQNAVKSEGGWTLEMINPRNACGGYANWKASTNPRGGTPGAKNSINAINHDEQLPALLRSFVTDSMNIILVFDEPLDSIKAIASSNYMISNNIGEPNSVSAIIPLFNRVSLRLKVPLQKNIIYTVTVRSVVDCSGNEIGKINTAFTGIASISDTSDLAINEILFNPSPGGVDYVEIYNRNNKIIDLKDLFIANRASNGTVGSVRPVAKETVLFFPRQFLVITENAALVKQQYYAWNPNAFAEPASMPSYPDDGGTVVLINARGTVIDEVRYSEKWHFKLIDNPEGVSLERIDYNKPSNDPGNWHSAATDAGYGTPGYRNSQFMEVKEQDGVFSIIPEVFSPDNDGFEDVATIQYQFGEPGNVCNISIFNADGRPVRQLVSNAICGLKGYFRWDGLDEKSKKLDIGIYVILIEIFNLKGRTKKYRKAIVLARRLR